MYYFLNTISIFQIKKIRLLLSFGKLFLFLPFACWEMSSIFTIETGVTIVIRKLMKWKIRKTSSLFKVHLSCKWQVWVHNLVRLGTNLSQSILMVFTSDDTSSSYIQQPKGNCHFCQFHDFVLVLNGTLNLCTDIFCSFCKHHFEISHQAHILPSKSVPHIMLQELSSQPGSKGSY